MVDSPIREEPHFVEGVDDELLFAPVDVPVLFLCLFVAPCLQGLGNAVIEECFEF